MTGTNDEMWSHQSWHAPFLYWDTCWHLLRHFYLWVDKRLNFKSIGYYYWISSSIYEILFHAKLIQFNDIDNLTINMPYFPKAVTSCFLVSDGNVRGKIEIYFLLWYSSHFLDKFLRVYCLKCSSLVVRIFSEYIDNFYYFSKRCVQLCQHWYAHQRWDMYLITK